MSAASAEESTVSVADVAAAERRIRPYVRRTPLLRLSVPTPQGPREVLLKLEQTQLGGSFKARGILNMALRAREEGTLPHEGVVIASGGNAGIAAAVAGRALEVPTTVVVPHNTPRGKLMRLESLGARLVLGAADHGESNTWADEHAAGTGALRLHAYNHRDVVAGAGTIASEALAQDPSIDSVVVAVGGGGLVAGITAAVQDRDVRVVGVEPEGAPTLRVALDAGRPTPTAIDTIARDSLGASILGDVPWSVCARADLESVLVSDDAIVKVQQWLWTECRLLLEHAAACALAALVDGVWQPPAGSRPLVVMCGANVADPLKT